MNKDENLIGLPIEGYSVRNPKIEWFWFRRQCNCPYSERLGEYDNGGHVGWYCAECDLPYEQVKDFDEDDKMLYVKL